MKSNRNKEIKEMVKNSKTIYRPYEIKVHKALDFCNHLTLPEMSRLIERVEKERYSELGWEKIWELPKWRLRQIKR